MLRKILILILCFIVNIIFCSTAHSAYNTKKFTGSYLENINIYQLGTYEFTIKFYGRNLPAPDTDFYENTMHVSLRNTRVKNIHAMKLLTENLANRVPVIADFDISENLSDDIVSILVKANSPLKIDSSLQNYDGFTMRVKALEEEEKSMFDGVKFLPSAKKSNPVPKNSLPFRADEKITVELRDADLKDVLRMLMARLERNIIIDSSFPQNVYVTMSLADVRADEVINYILRTYDISCYRAGNNTIAFGAKQNLYRLSGEREIKSFKISYADIASISTMLKSLASLQDNEITTDERMRTLYVNTNPAKIDEIEELIAKLDVPAQQVMIQASIFEFRDDATLDVQNALDIVYDEWQSLTISPIGGIGYVYDDLAARKVNRVITGTLTALERKEKGKILANPSVIALDGQQAHVKLTQDYIYTSGRDEAGNLERETEEVGPQLTFTPKVEHDGYVRLKLNIKTGEVIGFSSSGTTENIPITTDREVTTEVRVRNGMPFVVGGLFQENKTNNVARIPILGNIPLLGQLFSYNSKENSKTQVVMIVTPYILER